uniref:Protein kinase AMP-activated non-catalytic subunit beta 2 n=1 Tax=Sus scrofa TaxID=9823 RepID=A0A8D1V5Z1_PIG
MPRARSIRSWWGAPTTPASSACPTPSHNDFVAILDLPEGEHQYKFFVDGQWVHDPSETFPAHPQGLMVKKCMCFDQRRDSNPHPSCLPTFSKLFLTRTLIYLVTQPCYLSPIMLC